MYVCVCVCVCVCLCMYVCICVHAGVRKREESESKREQSNYIMLYILGICFASGCEVEAKLFDWNLLPSCQGLQVQYSMFFGSIFIF